MRLILLWGLMSRAWIKNNSHETIISSVPLHRTSEASFKRAIRWETRPGIKTSLPWEPCGLPHSRTRRSTECYRRVNWNVPPRDYQRSSQTDQSSVHELLMVAGAHRHLSNPTHMWPTAESPRAWGASEHSGVSYEVSVNTLFQWQRALQFLNYVLWKSVSIEEFLGEC